MSNWKEKVLDALHRSFYPVPQELNEIDWKSGLSNKTDRLAQHICTFANLKGGGVMVFGVSDRAAFESITKEDVEEIAKKLGNIANNNNLAWSIQLEHAVLDCEGHPVFFVHIPEQQNKPVYLRGRDIYDSYIRSAGHTVRMSWEQVHEMLAQSHGLTFEKRIAKGTYPQRKYLIFWDTMKYGLIKYENPDRNSKRYAHIFHSMGEPYFNAN